MKKVFCFLCAFVMIVLPACSEGEGSETDLPKVMETDFKLDDDFTLPPDVPACEYTADVASVDVEALQTIDEYFFGEGLWGRGEYTDLTQQDAELSLAGGNWFYKEKLYNSVFYGDGELQLYKGEYSEMYNDVEQILDRIVYFPAFSHTDVTLKGNSARLADLAEKGKSFIEGVLPLMGSDLKAVPLFCKMFVSAQGDLLYIDISYNLRTDNCVFRDSFVYNDRFAGDHGPGMNRFPVTHVYFYTVDDIMGIWQRGALVTNITQGSKLDIIDCEGAIRKAEEKYESFVKALTLKYAQLEYTPTERAGDNSFKYTPVWNLYYTDSKEVNGIISVDAVSGDIKNIVLGHSDFGDEWPDVTADLPADN